LNGVLITPLFITLVCAFVYMSYPYGLILRLDS
jgi:hypothetical protein